MTKVFFKIYILLFLFFIASCATDHSNLPHYRDSKGNKENYHRVSPYYQPPMPTPTVQRGYGGGYQYPPASRYYSNPYAFPPQNHYPYYDADQYYVPPTYYGPTDNDVSDGEFEKF